jgi:hypothetical protein
MLRLVSGSEPEETAPFTHRPYSDRDQDENPFISPSGPAAQPSGPSYVAPQAFPPPTVGPPYGPPVPPPQAGWGQGYVPMYGAPLPGSLDHKGAKTSLVLGIISVVSVVTALFCCVTIPGVFCAPFAWVVGARATREIDASPGVYGNRGAAQTGMIMGIVCTALGVLVIAAVVALFALLGSGWSLV